MMLKPGLELILKLDKNRIYINDKLWVSLSDTNINTERELLSGVFWVFCVIKYFQSESKVYGKVINYSSSVFDIPKEQNELIEKIEKISFKTLDTSGLLNSSREKEVKIFKRKDHKREPIRKIEQDLYFYEGEVSENKVMEEMEEVREERVKVNFEKQLEDIDFFDGHVEFNHYIENVGREVGFKIWHKNVQKKYDAIKTYIKKYLGLDSIKVAGEIVYSGKEVVEIIVSSADLDKIDDSIIEPMRFEYIEKEFIHARSSEIAKDKVYTIGNLYGDRAGGEVVPELLHLSEEEVFDLIVKSKKSRHNRHLNFLAHLHLSNKMKLRFTFDPISFIFLLESEFYSFVVWETLNTKEATYIWRISSKEKQVLRVKVREIENIIGTIKDGRKREYLKSDPIDLFRVQHDYSDFNKWKEDVKKVLST